MVPVGREHRIDAEGALMRSWLDDGQAELLPDHATAPDQVG